MQWWSGDTFSMPVCLWVMSQAVSHLSFYLFSFTLFCFSLGGGGLWFSVGLIGDNPRNSCLLLLSLYLFFLSFSCVDPRRLHALWLTGWRLPLSMEQVFKKRERKLLVINFWQFSIGSLHFLSQWQCMSLLIPMIWSLGTGFLGDFCLHFLSACWIVLAP